MNEYRAQSGRMKTWDKNTWMTLKALDIPSHAETIEIDTDEEFDAVEDNLETWNNVSWLNTCAIANLSQQTQTFYWNGIWERRQINRNSINKNYIQREETWKTTEFQK